MLISVIDKHGYYLPRLVDTISRPITPHFAIGNLIGWLIPFWPVLEATWQLSNETGNLIGYKYQAVHWAGYFRGTLPVKGWKFLFVDFCIELWRSVYMYIYLILCKSACSVLVINFVMSWQENTLSALLAHCAGNPQVIFFVVSLKMLLNRQRCWSHGAHMTSLYFIWIPDFFPVTMAFHLEDIYFYIWLALDRTAFAIMI